MPKNSLESKLQPFLRKRYDWRGQNIRTEREIEKDVRCILLKVIVGGDKNILRYTRKWDKAKLERLEVSKKEFEEADRQVKAEDKLVLKKVIDRFLRFYEAQKLREVPFVDKTGFYSERITPLDRVGLYVPGGRAPLISTLLMLSVPAKVAGVSERYVATPPNPDGSVPPLMLVAAKMTEVTAVFKMGGAQAIAAFAYGTRKADDPDSWSVPKVDKIFGPGNKYVTMAKKILFGTVGIDMLAGPSELVVIADGTASAEWIAEDLLAQAEHGPDSASLLLTTSPALETSVKNKINQEADKKIQKQIFVVLHNNLDECVKAVADIAPEHLNLYVAEPQKLLPDVGPAGAIFLGPTAVAYGDYVAGPNHTLPTAGTARFASPLCLESFFRRSSILDVRDPDGELAGLGATMAGWEGLKHHERSLRLRAKK